MSEPHYSEENPPERRPYYERQPLQHLEHFTKVPSDVTGLETIQQKYSHNVVPDFVYGKTNEKQRAKLMHKLEPVNDLGLIIQDIQNLTLADLSDFYLEPVIMESKLNRSDGGWERKEANSTTVNQNVRTEEVRRRSRGFLHNPFRRNTQ